MVVVDISEVLGRWPLLGGVGFRHLPIILPPRSPPFHVFLRLRPHLLLHIFISSYFSLPSPSPSISPPHIVPSTSTCFPNYPQTPFISPLKFLPPLNPPSTYSFVTLHTFRYLPLRSPPLPIFIRPIHFPSTYSYLHVYPTFLHPFPNKRSENNKHNRIYVIVFCNTSIYLNMSQYISFTFNVFLFRTERNHAGC